MKTRSLRPALILGLAISLLLALPTGGLAKKPTTPKLKLTTTKTYTTNVRPGSENKTSFFDRKALVHANCASGYQPLAIGVDSASNPLAGQDLGWVGMSVFVSGPAGTARTKLQSLCVRGGKAPTYIGMQTKISITGAGYAAAANLKCRSGYAALGAALAHGHAPALGAYTSMPDGTRGWTYRATLSKSVADSYFSNPGVLGYPRAACVRVKDVKRVEFAGVVTQTTPLVGEAKCPSGRALSWGVDLGAIGGYRGADAWAIPTIERAAFVGKSTMSFRFSRGSGGSVSGTPVRAVVICGTLRKG